MEEIVEGGESSIDRARCVNPEEVSMRALVVAPKPLVQLHTGMSSQGQRDKVEAEGEVEEKEKAKGEVEEMATGFTQESETPQRKKAMQIATPQRKMVPLLMVDDAWDMYPGARPPRSGSEGG